MFAPNFIEWRNLLFFFSSRRRHTRLQGDWSSDVCSSDLGTRTAWTLVGREENAVRADVLALLVGGERFELVTSVRERRQHPFHPVRVLLQRPDFGQWLRLRGERGVRLTVLPATLPSFPCLARCEEIPGHCSDR